MSETAKHTSQRFWRHPDLPHIELRSTFDSGRSFKTHSHPQLSLGAIIGGETSASIGNETHLCRVGDLILVPPDAAHGCSPVDFANRSYHMLYVAVDWCLEQLSALYGRPVKQLQCDGFVIRDEALFSNYMAVVALIDREECSLLAKALNRLLTDLLSQNCSPSQADHPDPLSRDVKKRLIQQLHEPPSLHKLARDFNCRAETIIRSFNKAYGISPRAFINNARIERAKLLLKTGESIAEVATSLGFSDQAQFHKTFVLYTAATPGQYQRGSQFSTIK